MRVKHVWYYVPLPAKLKLVYNRLTLSRIITAYFILALTHCVVQVVLQSEALKIERAQSVILREILKAGNVTEKFASLDSDDAIELCHAIPGQTSDPHPCQTFTGQKHVPSNVSMAASEEPGVGNGNRSVIHHDKGLTHANSRKTFHLQARGPVFTPFELNGELVVDASGLPGVSHDVLLGNTCTQVLAWPDQIVNQAKRESIAMMAFQVWLFGISIVAILNESIPHVVAALVTHFLSTAWASFQLARTENFEQRFRDIVTNVACHGVDLMPTYWRTKLNNQIPILVLNIASLLVSVFLSWKLCKQYCVQSFNRVGGSPRMHHIYLIVLVLSASLQLTTFFLIASLVLWIEQLFDGPIAPLAKDRTVYVGAFIATAALILPWLYMGWTAVRRERRRMMVAFLFTSLLLIASQTGMFISPVYRLTFSTWSFFGTLTVVAYILLVGTFLMAIVCRYFFGRGLAHFLQVQNALEACDFTPVYFERGSAEERTLNDEKETMPWDLEGQGVVKKMSLRRKSEDNVGTVLSPTLILSPSTSIRSPLTSIRSPPPAFFANVEMDLTASASRSKIKFADWESQETLVMPQVPSPSIKSLPLPPLIEDNASGLGHKRGSSGSTWYRFEQGREFIQRSASLISATLRDLPSPRKSPSTSKADPVAAPGHQSDSSTVSVKWYTLEGGRDLIQRGVNASSPIHRGFGFESPGQRLVGLPPSVKQGQKRPPGLSITIPETLRLSASNYYLAGRI